jgi:hypothetical protein
MIIETQCFMCQDKHDVEVDKDAYYAWKDGGMLIQDAMSELSADDRERLITGVCPYCWLTIGEE